MSPAERNRQRLKQVYWNLRLFGLPEPMRDVWMIVVTGLVVWSLVLFQGQQDQQTEGRKFAVLDGCRNDQAQDNVLRALIRSSLRQAELRYPDRDPYGRTAQDRQKLAEQLMVPLGGVELTKAEGDTLCERRLERARAEP